MVFFFAESDPPLINMIVGLGRVPPSSIKARVVSFSLHTSQSRHLLLGGLSSPCWMTALSSPLYRAPTPFTRDVALNPSIEENLASISRMTSGREPIFSPFYDYPFLTSLVPLFMIPSSPLPRVRFVLSSCTPPLRRVVKYDRPPTFVMFTF